MIKKIKELRPDIMIVLGGPENMYQFSDAIDISSDSYSPSVIAKYVYELAKNYNSFYQDDKIFDGKNNETTLFKISLSKMVLKTIKNALLLLNIRVPNKM